VAAVIALIGMLVVGCVALLWPALDASQKIQQNSNGQVSSVNYQWYNGTGEFRIWLAPGVPNTEGRHVACEVVRPTLNGTQFENTNFTIFGNDGLVAADERTSCG
jgi:hypothetical protein